MSKKRAKRAEKTFVICTRANAVVRSWLKKTARKAKITVSRFVTQIINRTFEQNKEQEARP